MVNVYKTSVIEPQHARELLVSLQHQFPEKHFNFDLEDCDKILRVEGDVLNSCEISRLLKNEGFDCVELLD